MKLFYTATSPYTRKVVVTAMEKGLCQDLELVTCNLHAAEPDLLAANPMNRVPTLVLDDGTALYDSPVICEWLDGRGEDPRLIPADGDQRWAVLRGQALADGMMDDVYANVVEGRRSAGAQDSRAMQARSDALLRCVPVLEAELQALPWPLTLAHIAAACALGYLDFRLPQLPWREEGAALAAWYADFARRPALAATRPAEA